MPRLAKRDGQSLQIGPEMPLNELAPYATLSLRELFELLATEFELAASRDR